MDTETAGDWNVPAVQEPLLGSDQSAEAGEAKEERKKRLKRANSQRHYKKHCAKINVKRGVWRKANKEKIRTGSKSYYSRHRQERSVKRKLHYQKTREHTLAVNRQWVKRNPEKSKAILRNCAAKLKLQTLQAYGGAICKCCGETMPEFLSLDHINHGRGNPYDRNRKRAGNTYYGWLRKNGFPPGIQVLCLQCNQAKGSFGVCPHQKLQTPIDLFFAS